MKAEIINGILEIYPQNATEDYALRKWYTDNVNQCTCETNGKNMGFNSYKKYKRSLWVRFRLWLHNIKYRIYKILRRPSPLIN